MRLLGYEIARVSIFWRESKITIGIKHQWADWMPDTPYPRSGGALGESIRA